MPQASLPLWNGLAATRLTLLRTACLWLSVSTLWMLTGCAQLPPPPRHADGTHWNGRLALQIDDQTAQSFSASFELQGSPRQGELVLISPLGSVLARLRWAPGLATLVSGTETQTSDSLDTLLQKSTGTQLPVAALFDWLNGITTGADGWQADLSGLSQGRLSATRNTPAPRTTLRIALDR